MTAIAPPFQRYSNQGPSPNRWAVIWSTSWSIGYLSNSFSWWLYHCVESRSFSDGLEHSYHQSLILSYGLRFISVLSRLSFQLRSQDSRLEVDINFLGWWHWTLLQGPRSELDPDISLRSDVRIHKIGPSSGLFNWFLKSPSGLFLCVSTQKVWAGPFHRPSPATYPESPYESECWLSRFHFSNLWVNYLAPICSSWIGSSELIAERSRSS